jgi:small subunit ribosomal protein S10
MQKAKINLACTDIDKLNDISNSIIDIAKKTKTKVSGPIPLPTRKLSFSFFSNINNRIRYII